MDGLEAYDRFCSDPERWLSLVLAITLVSLGASLGLIVMYSAGWMG